MTTSATVTLTPPANQNLLQYVDVNVAGSALDGIAQDTPIIINTKADIALGLQGVGIIGARVSAINTVRFAVKGINASMSPTVDVLVTKL